MILGEKRGGKDIEEDTRPPSILVFCSGDEEHLRTMGGPAYLRATPGVNGLTHYKSRITWGVSKNIQNSTPDQINQNFWRGGPGLVFFFFFFLIFIRIQLIYNAVLVSYVQKSGFVIIYIYPLFSRFFSHVGHYRVLSRVPCATQ